MPSLNDSEMPAAAGLLMCIGGAVGFSLAVYYLDTLVQPAFDSTHGVNKQGADWATAGVGIPASILGIGAGVLAGAIVACCCACATNCCSSSSDTASATTRNTATAGLNAGLIARIRNMEEGTKPVATLSQI